MLWRRGVCSGLVRAAYSGGKLRVYEAHALYYKTNLADVYNAERLLYALCTDA